MRLGEVRVAEDSDFAQLAALADEQHSWKLEYSTKSTQVWTKDTEDQHCKMIKVSGDVTRGVTLCLEPLLKLLPPPHDNPQCL